MGVYVYKSQHLEVIKVGHYCKSNPYSRIAHRGFYSCICPDEIKDKVSIDDLILLHWYPNLTPKDEKILHKILKEYRICGEWFNYNADKKLQEYIKDIDEASKCCKEDAILSKRRL